MDEFNYYQAIGISVVASLISVAMIGVVKFLYDKGVYDLIQRAVQRNVINVEGVWESEGEIEIKGVLTKYIDRTKLTQRGRSIFGETLYTETYGGKEYISKFKLVGIIKNDVVVGTYENTDRKNYGLGSFTFIVHQGGNELVGNYLIYNINHREIQSWPYRFTRKESA